MKVSQIAFCLSLMATGAAYGQPYKPVTVVQELVGWQCMSLSAVYGPQGTNAPPAPVFSGPDSSAPQVGTGAGIIIVPKPLRITNGRTEMIWPNGKKVWISVDILTPWHSLSDPSAVCHPALLSNGRYGFTTSG
jgi:hypothetical protein